jgi:hypothetical protein
MIALCRLSYCISYRPVRFVLRESIRRLFGRPTIKLRLCVPHRNANRPFGFQTSNRDRAAQNASSDALSKYTLSDSSTVINIVVGYNISPSPKSTARRKHYACQCSLQATSASSNSIAGSLIVERQVACESTSGLQFWTLEIMVLLKYCHKLPLIGNTCVCGAAGFAGR